MCYYCDTTCTKDAEDCYSVVRVLEDAEILLKKILVLAEGETKLEACYAEDIRSVLARAKEVL